MTTNLRLVKHFSYWVNQVLLIYIHLVSLLFVSQNVYIVYVFFRINIYIFLHVVSFLFLFIIFFIHCKLTNLLSFNKSLYRFLFVNLFVWFFQVSEKSVMNRVVRTVKTIVETPGNSGAEVKEARRVFIQNAQRGAKVVRKVAAGGASAQRIVVQKVASQVKTNVVAVENLSATTTEAQIRRMCQDIGNIEVINFIS